MEAVLKLLLWTLYLIPLVIASAGETESRVVHLSQGPVRGYKDPSARAFIFYGIPYATAPTGAHRFKGPLPPRTWQEPLEAVDKGIICPQTNSIMDSYFKTQQEDCLIANVYVPDTNEKNLHVLVSVHGGGFQIGFGEFVTYKNFVRNKNVIVVTFNYRLGVHGFLCLGTENAPGNAGMKDQVALLLWVKRNIANFGGNPEEVTLTGCSAGSVAVDLIPLSPSAKGLFTKIIPESGSNLGVFTIEHDPLERARNHAEFLNFTEVEDLYALEKFYTTAPYELLNSINYMSERDSTLGFVPCVERDTGNEVFLNDTPLNILRSGNYIKVPILAGFANMEGLIRLSLFDTWKDEMNENFSEFLPADLQFDNEEQKQEIGRKVKEFYFGNESVSEDNMFAYIDYFSDIMFAYPTLRSLKLQLLAGNEDIYLYEYSFVDVNGTVTGYKNFTTYEGANHGQQTMAIADGKLFVTTEDTEISEEYRKHKERMREMWHNFIISGKPVPEGSSLQGWPSIGLDWSPHMSLGNTMELKGSLILERALFWEKIYDQYYRSPVAPSPPTRHSEL